MTTVVDRLKLLLGYILDRAQEPSTMRGALAATILITGGVMSPDRLDAVAFIATAASAALKILLPDSLKKPE